MAGRVEEREIRLIIWRAVNGKDFKTSSDFSDIYFNYFTFIRKALHVLDYVKIDNKLRLDATKDAICHLSRLEKDKEGITLK